MCVCYIQSGMKIEDFINEFNYYANLHCSLNVSAIKCDCNPALTKTSISVTCSDRQ